MSHNAAAPSEMALARRRRGRGHQLGNDPTPMMNPRYRAAAACQRKHTVGVEGCGKLRDLVWQIRAEWRQTAASPAARETITPAGPDSRDGCWHHPSSRMAAAPGTTSAMAGLGETGDLCGWHGRRAALASPAAYAEMSAGGTGEARPESGRAT